MWRVWARRRRSSHKAGSKARAGLILFFPLPLLKGKIEKVKKQQLKVKTSRQASRFSLNLCGRRFKYPRTTEWAASEAHAAGYATMHDSYRWPTDFLKALSLHYGQSWLAQKLRKWKWNFSTALSGVGAPESVGCLLCNPNPMFCQAAISLQRAARKFLDRIGRSDSAPNMLFNFSVEIDKPCSQVLASTYNVCNFNDICLLNPKAKKSWCTTHKRMCCLTKRESSGSRSDAISKSAS